MLVDQMMDYENGDMTEEQQITFFQELIDTGLAWILQGYYGRAAQSFIQAGLCTKA